MNYTLYYISQIIVQLLGISFAYKILNCEKVESKWILYTFIFVQIMGILGSLSGLIYKPHTKTNIMSNTKTSTIKVNPTDIALMSTLFTFIIMISIACFIFNLYFLFKLYQCNNSWFLIYLLVSILSMIPACI